MMGPYELRDRCVTLIVSEHLSTTEAVEKVLSDATLDEETTYVLVREGLRHLVDGANTRDRARRPEGSGESGDDVGAAVRSGKFQHRPDQHELSARFYWLSKTYATADGPQAPILAFGRDDVAAALTFAACQASEWSAREGLWRRIDGELGSRQRVKTVGDLPLKVLAELDVLAGSALGGLS